MARNTYHQPTGAAQDTSKQDEIDQGVFDGKPESIPTVLREYDHWVCWESVERDDGKAGKIPLKPTTREQASVANPETWSTFDVAEAVGKAVNVEEADGFGFVFSDEDPFVGIDLDDCVVDGELASWARDVIDKLDSYTEVSPSGTGIHIILRGSLPGEKCRSGDVEMYDTKRFFTVTGRHLNDTPESINQRQAALEEVYAEYLSSESEDDCSQAEATGVENAPTGNDLDDDEVLQKARASKKGKEFKRLWKGDTSGHESHSEADMALCCRLAFWTGGDTTQMDRLFRKSGLMRSKWMEDRGDRTYGDITIKKAISKVDEFYERKEGAPNPTPASAANTTQLQQAQRVVTDEFGARTWDITEAALAVQATLLLDTNQNVGLVFVGNSGSGKTTVLRFLEDYQHVVRSDDATPASFVSADASLTEEELEENDLLPRIRHQTLVCRDMATWFSGDRETIREKMSVMAHLMDGDGYARDTGSHGPRKYVGDYRFNFLGASTPLPKRSWEVMGHTGTRFVFHEKRDDRSVEEAVAEVFESDYDDKVSRCKEQVQQILDDLWETHAGYGSVEGEKQPPAEVLEVITDLAKLIIHARAPITNDEAHQEGVSRIATTLRDLARGRALLDGRTELRVEDANVCARVALSTMPQKRRPVVRALLDPANDGSLTASQVMSIAGVSRPTAHSRMEELDTLGLGDCSYDGDDGREPKLVTRSTGFEWPDSLSFPQFEGGDA